MGRKRFVHGHRLPRRRRRDQQSFESGSPCSSTEVLGHNAVHGFKWTVANDTRDSAFLATEGHFLQMELEEVVGSFQYPRAIFDARQYLLLSERPDHSGRHVLTLATKFGFTGNNTPIYDTFYAGGFSSLRGFDFRGASPVVQQRPGRWRLRIPQHG